MSRRQLCSLAQRLVAAAVLLSASVVTAAAEPEIRPWTDGETPLRAHFKSGTWTLVMFWSVTCSICAVETPALNSFYKAERDNGVHLLGVSIDGGARRDEVAQWMKRHHMGFPTLLGELRSIAVFFDTSTQEPFRGTPTFLLYDRSGRLVGMNTGPVRAQAIKDFIARKERGR